MAKLDSAGSHAWSRGFGDVNDQYSYNLAIDPADNILVAGEFSNSIGFGDGTLPSAASYDAFIAKLEP